MNKTSVEVWIKAAVPPGSGRYYACLHEKQPEYTATILTLYSIWSKLAFSNREIEAARKQVEWWQLELARPTPLHPVTNALKQGSPQHYKIICTHLSTVLSGYESLLTEGSQSRSPALTRFHAKTGATAAKIIAGTVIHHQSNQLICDIGIALSKFRCIRYLQKHAANGLLCLPFEALSEAGVSPADLVPGRYSQQLTAFLHQQLSTINADLDQFFTLATGNSECRFLYIYAKLQQLLLNKFQKNLSLLDNPEYRLSPLRNFWHSYRATLELTRKQYQQQKAG